MVPLRVPVSPATLLKPVTARAALGPWRRGRMRGRFGLGAALAVSACALVVAACGGSSSSSSSSGGGGGGSSSSSSSGITVTGAKVIDPNSMNNPPKGTIHYCTGKDTDRCGPPARQGLQREVRERRLQGRADRVPGVSRPAARAVHPASAGEEQRLRRLQLGRHLDGGVREPEVALRPVAVRQQVPVEVSSRRRSRPSTTPTSTGASRRRATRRSSSTGPTR